ncbi:MAG: hypothetical protein ACRD4Y_14130, partial [Candidatus Acidiferrales bacterium]
TTDRTRLEKLRGFCAKRGLEFYAISSASGEGIPELVRGMADALDRLAPAEPLEPEIFEGAASELDSREKESPDSAPPAAAPRTEER